MRNKCLGIFLVFVTFPLVILTITFLSMRPLYDSGLYKNILAKNNSYSKITENIQKTKTEDALTNTLIADITPQWLQKNIESNLDILFVYLNKKSSNANFAIDISPFQKDLQNQIPSGVNIIIPPVLSFASYNNFLSELSANNSDFSKLINAQNVQNQLNSSANLQTKINHNLSNFQRGLYYYKIISYIIFGLLILMLIIIGIAARRYSPAIPRWAGQAIFIPAILYFLIIYSIKILATHYSLISSLNLELDTFNIVNPIYHDLLQTVIHNFILYSSIFAFIGLCLIIVSYIWGQFKPMPKIIGDQNVQNVAK